MVNKFVLEEYAIDQEEIQRELEEIIGGDSLEKIEAAFDTSVKKFDLGTILKGRILGVIGNNVILDTGYKSEGTIPLSESTRRLSPIAEPTMTRFFIMAGGEVTP